MLPAIICVSYLLARLYLTYLSAIPETRNWMNVCSQFIMALMMPLMLWQGSWLFLIIIALDATTLASGVKRVTSHMGWSTLTREQIIVLIVTLSMIEWCLVRWLT